MDNEKILIIDDDENIVKILSLYLRSRGYEVITCLSGNHAVEVFDRSKPDLVLLDIMLPGKDGNQILSEIRSKSHTPIIMLTAKGETDEKIGAFDCGADDYIVKPFDSKELFARIRAVLRRTSSTESESETESGLKLQDEQRIEFANITVSLDEYKVTRDGVSLHLTPKEIELLYLLAKNIGKAMSRSELLRLIWGNDYYGDGRTLDVHIKRIRDTLGRDNSWRIVTISSIGYRLELT